MFSLNGTSFTNNSLSGVSRCLTQSSRRISAPMVVVAAVSSNGKPGDGSVSVLVENALTESAAPVEMEVKSTVTGGVQDVYGEDSATEDQSITPWTLSVARYCFPSMMPLCSNSHLGYNNNILSEVAQVGSGEGRVYHETLFPKSDPRNLGLVL